MESIDFERFNVRNPKNEINHYTDLILKREISSSKTFSILLNQDNLAGLETLFWVLREVSRKDIDFFEGIEELLYEVWLKHPDSDMISRNFLGLLQEIKIPNFLEDRIYERSFKLLTQVSQPIAVKAFSMSICFKIAQKYPELLHELRMVIEDIVMLYGQESGALLSRGRQILKKINRRLHK